MERIEEISGERLKEGGAPEGASPILKRERTGLADLSADHRKVPVKADRGHLDMSGFQGSFQRLGPNETNRDIAGTGFPDNDRGYPFAVV